MHLTLTYKHLDLYRHIFLSIFTLYQFLSVANDILHVVAVHYPDLVIFGLDVMLTAGRHLCCLDVCA